MELQMSATSRKDLKNKMAVVFGDKIKTLSIELQGVLLDDLVTALENRLVILNRINENAQIVTAITENVDCETVQT
jgi:hypothetical protein